MSQILPLSLAAYFVPPVDNVGVFAMLTGYSADEHFLNDALEKFTQNIKSQRAYEGVASFALMLDETHHQITAVDCPGLAHLASNPAVKNKFKLLHAKVALLLFNNKDTEQKTIRLVVSTGNWTRQTLADSLDLVWSIDFEIGQYEDEQVQTDIAKAYDFINYTLSFFDGGLLSCKRISKSLSPTSFKYQQFTDALNTFKAVNNITPRFFDNRSHSLLSQLPDLVTAHASDRKRNYLCIGSGFYEGGNASGQIPIAISAIEQELRKSDLLIKKPCKDIFINPQQCQAISESTEALTNDGWQIRSSFDSLYQGKSHTRSLHAKFIFSANEGGEECQRPWLYLGSGNITAPGFLNQASLTGGNLEAGMVFSPEGLTWFSEEEPDLCISHKLPINRDDESIITDEELLSAGGEMPEHDGLYISAPVSYFTFIKEINAESWLLPSENSEQKYQVLSLDNEICKMQEGRVSWLTAEPRQVLVSWQCNDQIVQVYVPVLDEFGRMAATELPELELDDAWMLLGTFPTLPSEGHEEGYEDKGYGSTSDTSTGSSDYHLNKMMALIEYIAQKQTEIKEFDWPQWCHRLEQTFCQMENSSSFEYFRKIGINPLSALLAKPFRPDFAENNQTEAGLLYEHGFSRIEATLKLTNLLKFGDLHE